MALQGISWRSCGWVGALTAGAQVQLLVSGLRSCKPWNAAKKKKKKPSLSKGEPSLPSWELVTLTVCGQRGSL